jgi:hypothetical protein
MLHIIILEIIQGVGVMLKHIPVLDLSKFRQHQESFIYGVSGALRLSIINETLYNFLPSPLAKNESKKKVSTFVKCIFAVTDKRIIIIGKNHKGELDANMIYSIDFNEIEVTYKKSFGSRIFKLNMKNNLFNFLEQNIIFEVNHRYNDFADTIYMLICECKEMYGSSVQLY